MSNSRSNQSYKPIADYGAIGNLRTVALVGSDGSVDWCCFPHLDRGSVFAAILDHHKGGRFRVHLENAEHGEQRYLPLTNVLETTFRGGKGTLTVTDWMPLSGTLHGCGESHTASVVLRLLRCEGAPVTARVEWSPRFDYARATTRIERNGDVIRATGGEGALALRGAPEVDVVAGDDGPVAQASIRMEPGDTRLLATEWGNGDFSADPERARASLEETAASWRTWADRSGDGAWAGRWQPLVQRSELALKLVTHDDTGAMAAAPTASLPETIGGVRNWDYRFTWIRDASLTAQALLAMGHEAEVRAFLHWAERVSAAHGDERRDVRIMYGLHGETELPEVELEHFEGYRNSRPVNIGNAAADQRQLDVFGELMGAAAELVRLGVELEPEIRRFLGGLADRACADWHKPDEGIWEIRREPRHHVYSKMMVWRALDRALWLADRGIIEGDVARWRQSRQQVREVTLERGYDRDRGAFTIAFGAPALDAANLLMPVYGFLPADDPRMQGTIDRTLEELTENGLVYRYRTDDGLPGEEGAFVLCTFWLIDALALSGRVEEARELFDGLAGRANQVGLLSEQIDPRTGEFLGNFPQAFSHIGLINSTLYLARAEGRETPGSTPLGVASSELA